MELKGPNPFDKIKIGTYRASKEQLLTIGEINRLQNYIPANVWDQRAKDTFLFSFYAAGMSSIDVLQLTWQQIRGERIVFSRNKVKDSSGVQLSLPINPVLSEILSRQDRNAKTVFNLVTMFGESKAACMERGVV